MRKPARRFRKILRVLLILLLFFGHPVPLLPRPKQPLTEEVPERLARVMLEEQAETAATAADAEGAGEAEDRAEGRAGHAPAGRPEAEGAREGAEAAEPGQGRARRPARDHGYLKPLEMKNLSGAVGADAHAERSLITSKVGVGSGGITSADTSRGFGGGAGSLTGHETTAVELRDRRFGLNCAPAASAAAAASRPARARRSSWSSTATRDVSTASTRARSARTPSCRASLCLS